MVLPGYDVEVVWGGAMPFLDAVCVDEGGFLLVFLESFSKVPGGLPCVFLITYEFSTLVVIYSSTLLVHGFLVFGFTYYLLNSPIHFERSLDTIFAASLLDALPQCLCVRNNYVMFTVFFPVGFPPCDVAAGIAGAFFLVFLWVLHLPSCWKPFFPSYPVSPWDPYTGSALS